MCGVSEVFGACVRALDGHDATVCRWTQKDVLGFAVTGKTPRCARAGGKRCLGQYSDQITEGTSSRLDLEVFFHGFCCCRPFASSSISLNTTLPVLFGFA